MSEELVKINTMEQLEQGAAGINFGNKLFRLKPCTLTINQSNTQVEGVTPGKLRVVETGEEFTELTVCLLDEPQDWRQYHLGNEDRSAKGQMNKTPENLLCYSHDMKVPDKRSRQPQAITCGSCAYSQWDNSVTPGLPPICDPFFFVPLVDVTNMVPLKFYARGSSKTPFEAGMLNFTRKFRLLQRQGQKPNVYSLSFKITTEKHKNKAGATNWKLKIDGLSFKMLSPEDAKEVGQMYLDYKNYGVKSDEDVALEKTAEVDKQVDNEVVEGEIII